MATVTNTIKLPDGTTPSYAAVVVELVASTTSRAAGWITANDTTILSVARPTVTAGAWSADLTPNANITPSGTVYKVTETANKVRYVHYISVPSGGGSVFDLLTDEPASVASAALQSYIDSQALDVTSYGSAPDDWIEAIEAARASGRTAYFPPGSYVFADGDQVEWDMSSHSVRGEGATLDFSALTTGTAVLFSGRGNKSSSYDHRGYLHQFSGFRILGPEALDTVVDCIKVDDTSGADGGSANHLYVYGFRDHIQQDANNWCIRWDDCAFGHFARYGVDLSPGSNAGENWQFYGCTWFSSENSGACRAVRTSGNPDASFYGCSFDYLDKIVEHGGGKLTFVGCHFEDDSTLPMWSISHTSGQARTHMVVVGGTVQATESAPGRSALAEFTGASDKASLVMTGVFVDLYDKTTTFLVNNSSASPVFRHIACHLDNSGGGTRVSSLGQHTNALYNGDFETSQSFVGDGAGQGWSTSNVSVGTKTITSDLPRSGTYSCKVVGNGTAGIGLVFQYFPAIPNAEALISGWLNVPSVSAGSVQFRYAWYMPNRTSRIAITNVGTATTSATSGWVPFSARVTVPKGVGFGYVDLEIKDFNGTAYIDDLCVSFL